MTLNWVCKPTGVYPQAYPAAYARRYPLLAGFFMPVGYLTVSRECTTFVQYPKTKKNTVGLLVLVRVPPVALARACVVQILINYAPSPIPR